jgi:hypothetical protein
MRSHDRTVQDQSGDATTTVIPNVNTRARITLGRRINIHWMRANAARK